MVMDKISKTNKKNKWAPKAWNCSTEGEDSIKVLFSPFYMVLRTDNARVFCMVAELLWYDDILDFLLNLN